MSMVSLKLSIVFFISILLVIPALSFKQTRTFKINNKCSYDIWVGAIANPNPSPTGWKMTSKSSYDLKVASNTASLRIWARTGCRN